MGDDGGGVVIDTPLLYERLNALVACFASHSEQFGSAGAVQLAHGKRKEGGTEEPFVVSFQSYVFGYEFPDTLAVLVGNTLYVHATAKKLQFLQPASQLTSGAARLVLLTREKGDTTVPANRAAMDQLLAAVQGAGSKMGYFPTDALDGLFIEGWTEEVAKAGIEKVDATRGIEAFFASKDETAVGDVKRAGVLAARLFRQVLQAEMESYVDKSTKISNAKVAEASLAIFENRKELEKRKVNVDSDNWESCLGPIVQSGGEGALAVLTPGAVASSAAPLSNDVIIMGLGVRYKGMRSGLARTFLIDPSPRMQKMYDAVLATHECLINGLVPGAVIGEVVVKAREVLLAMPDLPLDAKLHKNFGSGMGVRLGDRHLVLNAKSTVVVAQGMSFVVTTGLSHIPMSDKHASPDAAVNKLTSYSLLIADTVVVGAAAAAAGAASAAVGCVCVTDKCDRKRKAVSYEMAGEDEEEEEEEEEEDAQGKSKKSASRKPSVKVDTGAGRDANGRSARLKEKAKDVDPDAAAKRHEHQMHLIIKKQEAVAKKKRGGGAAAEEDAADAIENAPAISVYKSISEYPARARLNQIVVDKTHEALLVPWQGMLVPIALLAIKNVVKSEEGGKHFLRINLYAPGATKAALTKDTAPSMAAALMRHPDAVYIKTLNFMAKDPRNFNAVDLQVKAMLKRQKEQRKEAKEANNLVEQARLVPTRGTSVPSMQDINMWPAISGRRTQGNLAAHGNGFLFSSNKGERIEILYSNVKLAVFQPCEDEHIVLLHFHLKHAILVGKKKYKDLQFFTEVIESSELLDARGRSDHDPDELGEEERQRKLKKKLNEVFYRFAKRCEEIASADASGFSSFDIPQAKMSFLGAPFKEMTTVRLAASAIIAVVDKPPLVVPIDDMELVHFERVVHGGKTFDMVIVFKEGAMDKGLPEFVRITGIEMKSLEDIKAWLDGVADVIFTESLPSLQWDKIIPEQVRRVDFWETIDAETGERKHAGVYGFLSEFAAGGSSSEEESEAFSGGEDASDESSSEGSAFEDLDSEDDSGDDASGGGGSDDDEDEESDWEGKAAAADEKKRSREADDEGDRKPSKKKRKDDD